MLGTEFPFINVPPEALPMVGEAMPGTRFYRREGTDDQCGEWVEGIGRFFGGDVGLSPGGVVMFVPVSRAAVHKRLREGRLTGFAFHVTSQGKSIWGKPRKLKERPYVMLSVSECKAWAHELKRRAGIAEATNLGREAERARMRAVAAPDEPTTTKEVESDDEFVEKDPKDRGKKEVVYDHVPREEIMFMIQCEMRRGIEEILGKLLPGKVGAKHRRRAADGQLEYNYKTKNGVGRNNEDGLRSGNRK